MIRTTPAKVPASCSCRNCAAAVPLTVKLGAVLGPQLGLPPPAPPSGRRRRIVR